jgi:signal transduction histidine kinase
VVTAVDAQAASIESAAPRPRLTLPEIANVTLALRWLALAVLIALSAITPPPPVLWPTAVLFGAAILYTVALTLYVVRYPDRAQLAAQWAIPCDTILLITGTQVTTLSREFLILGFPLAVMTGMIAGRAAAGAVAAGLAVAVNPLTADSLFPHRWVAWGLLGFCLVASGQAGAAAYHRLAARTRFSSTLTRIRAAIAAPTPQAADAAQAALDAAVAHFQADSGALLLLDPQTKHLHLLASSGLTGGSGTLLPDSREGLTGWMAQGGRAILVRPGGPAAVELDRWGIHSSLRVAVLVAGRPLGVLTLGRSSPDHAEFTSEDLEDLELIAHALSTALLHAQDEQILATALTDLAGGHAKVSYALTRDPIVLWPALLDLLRSLTSAQFAVLALEREDSGNVEIVAARGIDGAAARALLPGLLAAATRGAIHDMPHSGDAPRTSSSREESAICVPLSLGERTIGAAALGPVTEEICPRPILLAIAAHIAAAVDATRTAHRVADIGAGEERRRIAREMHDGVAQTLANALLQVDLSAITAQSAPERLGPELKETRALLEQAMREIREFLAELRRAEDGDDRLFQALQALAIEGKRHHLSVTVIPVGNDDRLPPAVRHAVLAIARQALTNVHAHAQASAVTARAEVTDEMCAVSITDDGIGFNVTAYRATRSAGHHLGLASMEERAALVGGRLTISSAPNRGTTVTVHVPLGVIHG